MAARRPLQEKEMFAGRWNRDHGDTL